MSFKINAEAKSSGVFETPGYLLEGLLELQGKAFY